MRRNTYTFVLTAILMLGLGSIVLAKNSPYVRGDVRGPVRGRLDVANPQDENRVHDAGKMRMNITNYGYFGNDGPNQTGALEDPCPPNNWAPQCEFPSGSGQQYLFQGALWIGALIEEEGFFTTRVSVGTDGWQNPSINEFHAGEGVEDQIRERSNRPGFTNCFGEVVYDSFAVSDQDFICVMTDTLKDDLFVRDDPTDGPHRPLGIKITQKSYSFSQAFAEDFIIIDYEIENIASNFLKNVYVGLYVDADVGVQGDNNEHTDDICGFVREVAEVNAEGDTNKIRIDVAWIADNDGYPDQTFGGAFTVPHVTGTRVIRAPNPRLFTSFNWYNPNQDHGLDYGPAWEAYANRDSLGLGWTAELGTPEGDAHKYQLMGNREFDFWQTSVDELCNGVALVDSELYNYENDVLHVDNPFPPQRWSQLGLVDPETCEDIANGYDTRYLLSWGPLGIYDFTDGAGNDIYRLNPGEKFKMTIAYVAGENFHDPNNPQTTNANIDTSKFDFTDLKDNARWAKDVYDNRMFDTPIFDWGFDGDVAVVDADGTQGDGILDTGDGWYGEDVGEDGLFGVIPIGRDSIPVTYFKGSGSLGSDAEIFAGYYTGPDVGERNGRIDTIRNNAILSGRTPFPAITEDDIIPPTMVYAFNVFHPLQLGAWDMGWMSGNKILDFGDGIPDFTGPPPPPIPALLDCVPNTSNAAQHFGGIVRPIAGDCQKGGLGYELRDQEVILRWSKSSSESPTYRDPFSRVQDFEGYRIHVGNVNQERNFEFLAQFDVIDFAYFAEGTDSLMTVPVQTEDPTKILDWGTDCNPNIEDADGTQGDGIYDCGPAEIVLNGVRGIRKPVGANTGFGALMGPYFDQGVYEYSVPSAKLAPRYYAITSFDFGDPKSGLTTLSTRATANAVLLAPAGNPRREVTVVPNPYRAYQDYTSGYRGQSWENQNDGTSTFFPQVDRRIEFMNLPDRAPDSYLYDGGRSRAGDSSQRRRRPQLVGKFEFREVGSQFPQQSASRGRNLSVQRRRS
jgi:hypothetical protein